MKNIAKLFCSVAVLSAVGFGKTFVVSNTSEFRAALENSVKNGESDTIKLKSGIYKINDDGGGTFSYTDDEPYDLNITTNSPNDKVILDGEGKNKVFYYKNEKSVNFLLTNITIQNGKTDFLDSGAGLVVEASNANMIINNCNFKNNIAGVMGGGAINASVGKAIIKNSFFKDNNSSTYGGAVYLYSKSFSIIFNSIFEHNNANYIGSAIYTANPIYIINSDFINNGKSTLKLSALPDESKSKIINNIFYNNKSDLQVYDTNIKLYNNYISNGKIVSENAVIVKRNNINPHNNDIKFISNSVRLSSDSPVLSKGMDVQSEEFKKLILDKDNINRENLDDDEKTLLSVLDELKYDKASKKRKNKPDLGAYEYDPQFRSTNSDEGTSSPIDTEEDNSFNTSSITDTQGYNPSNNSNIMPNTTSGKGGGAMGWLLPLFALLLFARRRFNARD